MTRPRKRRNTPSKSRPSRSTSPSTREYEPGDPAATDPDWTGKCEVCGASPVVPVTGLCGPCTFGEAETAGGNW